MSNNSQQAREKKDIYGILAINYIINLAPINLRKAAEAQD
jgi:hypothetical protein